MQEKYTQLNDSQWQVMASFLPVQRKRQINLREVVDAIFWIARTGAQWRNLSEGFPPWPAVYYYFRRWKKDGTLDRLNIGLNMIRRIQEEKNPDPSLICIDSQSVKANAMNAQDRGLDGNKRVNGRKRQTLVDTMGLVWGVLVHAANGSDTVFGAVLMIEVKNILVRVKRILVDQGYAGEFIAVCKKHLEVTPEISSRPPTRKGFVPLQWRWVSERTFGWFNFFRRLSKDYEKTAESSEAWIIWVNCQINIAKFGSMAR